MGILIRLKHWQIILLFSVFFIGMILVFLSSTDINEALSNAAVLFFLHVFFYNAWLYSAGTALYENLEDKSGFNIKFFRIANALPLIYFIILIFTFGEFLYQMKSEEGLDALISLLLLLHFISLICLIYANYFIAKSLRSIELGRQANFAEYMGYLFLLWFIVIGIFIIQPKLNELTKRKLDY